MAEKRPLLVATDENVREEVLRIAAAVECELDHAPDAIAAGDAWTSAPVVLLDTDALVANESRIPQRSATSLVCCDTPSGETWEQAFTSGVAQVITLPVNETELVSMLADDHAAPGDQRGPVIAVIGARGGAGCSVLAGAVAMRSVQQRTASLLLDCDPLGGGLDLLLGLERSEGLRWPGLLLNSGRVAISDLHAALPDAGVGEKGLAVLSCGRSGPGPVPEAVRSVIDAGRRAGETVVCDLDRAVGPAAAAAVAEADRILLVVPSEVRACAAATRVAARLEEHTDRAALRVVGRPPGPDGLCDVDVADSLELPLLATLRHERGLSRALERGEFTGRNRGPLASVARTVLTEVNDPSEVRSR